MHRLYPQALKVLDLQDLHSLRNYRHNQLHQLSDNQLVNQHVLKPDLHIADDQYLQREIASIKRMDLVFTCSDYEKMLLTNLFDLKNIELLTFFYQKQELEKQKKKSRFRKHAFFIGNYSHKPNADAIDMLIQQIWPKIHQIDQSIELHIYGSNFNLEKYKDMQINKNIKLKGQLEDISRISKYRLQVAPLRFGAGIKGKITDSWLYGVPVITTPIGSEGLYDTTYTHNKEYQGIDTQTRFYSDSQQGSFRYSSLNKFYQYNDMQVDGSFKFGGSWNHTNIDSFVDGFIKLYNDQNQHQQAQEIGYDILENRMMIAASKVVLDRLLSDYQYRMDSLRRNNHIQQILWSETLRSTELRSKYIETKRNKPNQ